MKRWKPAAAAAIPRPAPRAAITATDYLSQLKVAQERVVEHNSSIHRLLEHIRSGRRIGEKEPGPAENE